MTIQELEQQVLSLDLAGRIRILQVLAQSLTSPPVESFNPSLSSAQPAQTSIVDFFRNSPLCSVADELDLTRDKSPILDRISL